MSIPLETRIENISKGFGVDVQLAWHMLILASRKPGSTDLEQLMQEFHGDTNREATETEE